MKQMLGIVVLLMIIILVFLGKQTKQQDREKSKCTHFSAGAIYLL